MRPFLLVLLLSVPAHSQFLSFIPTEDEDYEASNGLMAPPGTLVLYYKSEGPLSFVASALKDVPPDAARMGEVYGRACQYGLGIPLTPPTSATGGGGASLSAVVGDGSYRAAFSDMKRRHPDLGGVFDVKVDAHTVYLLTIFRRVCTEVTAKGFRLRSGG